MVIESVIFGLLAAVGWGIADFLTAAISKNLGILRTVVGVNIIAVGVTTAFLFLVSGSDQISATQWVTLSAMSVLGFITYLGFYKALQIGPVALVSPIVAAYAVVVIILAVVFLGERLSSVQAVGATASIVGVVFASLNLRGLTSLKGIISKGVLYGLGAMVGIGVWQYFIGVLSRDMGWFLPIYINRLIILAMLALVTGASKTWPWQRLTIPIVAGIVIVGLAETGGLFAFSRGAEIGVISIVAAASTSYPVIPILGGLIIFQERLEVSQIAGLVVALVGLLVLGLGS